MAASKSRFSGPKYANGNHKSQQKAYNKTKTPPAPVEEAPKGPTAEELLVEIRDALKK